MPKSHPPYPAEFRAKGVELVRSSGKAVVAIAADLGVSEPTLRQWMKQAEVDAGQRGGLTTDELSELRRLRRENFVLRQEREIRKKAAAFFVREPGRSLKS